MGPRSSAAEALPPDRLDACFGALADRTRRDIVSRLADGDATLTELSEHYDVSVQAVSKHLKVLEDAGLVSRTRDAQRSPMAVRSPARPSTSRSTSPR